MIRKIEIETKKKGELEEAKIEQTEKRRINRKKRKASSYSFNFIVNFLLFIALYSEKNKYYCLDIVLYDLLNETFFEFLESG